MNKELTTLERAAAIGGGALLCIGGVISGTQLGETLPGLALIIAGAIILGLFAVWKIISSTVHVLTLCKKGISATATVTSVTRRYKYIGFTLSYCDENGKHHSIKAENPMTLKLPEKDGTFDIKYDPNNFKSFIIVPSDYYKLAAYYLVFIMPAGAVATAVIL